MAYYGPTKESCEKLNKIFGFKATGNEQDWEIEFSDPKKLEMFITVLTERHLDDETERALICLIIASFDDAVSCNISIESLGRIVAKHLRNNKSLDDKIKEYWTVFGSHFKNSVMLEKLLIK